MKRDDDWYNCTCPTCGKRFHLKPYSVKRAKRHFCSKECFYKEKHNDMAGENNHQYGLKGSKNASWKSDRRLSKYGYWQIRCLDHPFRDDDDLVFEHRLVAEKYLLTDENSTEVDGKRYLSKDYVVHHIDFNRLNNSPDNLIVMKKGDHQRLHTMLNPMERDKKTGRFVPREDDILKMKKVTMTAIMPKKATEGAACYDLYPDIDEPVTIEPDMPKMLSTGIAMQIPDGYCGLIFARSGIATRMGLRPTTCVSVIDSDYRGNVGLPMFNDSKEPQTIYPGERIAQLLISKPVYFKIKLVDSLDETERSEGGFGSTGR